MFLATLNPGGASLMLDPPTQRDCANCYALRGRNVQWQGSYPRSNCCLYALPICSITLFLRHMRGAAFSQEQSYSEKREIFCAVLRPLHLVVQLGLHGWNQCLDNSSVSSWFPSETARRAGTPQPVSILATSIWAHSRDDHDGVERVCPIGWM